ncbi:MAG: Ribosomal large subunit pseudouridine synthase C [Myxococcota bacterium]|nr:Ribosomal large subunit pseudouridine synthase C [Myxococcota bacterium]
MSIQDQTPDPPDHSPASPALQEYRAGADDDGRRLDRLLRGLLRGAPLSHVYKLLRTKRIRVNGQAAKPDRLLRAGDVIQLRMDARRFENDTRRKTRFRSAAPAPPLAILHEDEALLVLNKPPGLAVHPGAGQEGITLIDQALDYLGPGQGGVFRPALAHRLDRDTSGVIIVCKQGAALRHLVGQWKNREVEKRYLALVRGVPRERAGVIDESIERRDAPHAGAAKVSAARTGGQRALSRYRVLDSGGGCSLLEVTIETGRTHQIRAHLLSRGWPILGDERYGDAVANQQAARLSGLKRQALHSWRLKITHPLTDQPVEFVAPPPEDFSRAGAALGLKWPRERE